MHGSSGRAPPRGSWPALRERIHGDGAAGAAPQGELEQRIRAAVADRARVNAARNHVARRVEDVIRAAEHHLAGSASSAPAHE